MTTADFEAEIKKITAQIVKKYKPDKIILFGSVARGKTRPDSDIDMLIIKKKPRKKFIHRIGDVLDITDSTRIEPLVYTPQEVKKRLAIKDFFIQEILDEGKVLYEKD
jgi:predicted nucleotidyltransferase